MHIFPLMCTTSLRKVDVLPRIPCPCDLAVQTVGSYIGSHGYARSCCLGPPGAKAAEILVRTTRPALILTA